MTEPLHADLADREVPAARRTKRPRTWLVALLSFGAADLLVLNLWAVPNLVGGPEAGTTTDMRAAQRGAVQADVESEPIALQPSAAEPEQALEPQDEAAPAQEPQDLPSAATDVDIDVDVDVDVAKPTEPPRDLDLAPRAEPPPGGAPPTPSDLEVPADPAVARAFAIRSAQRALRIAMSNPAAGSGRNPFASLTDADQPFTQIFFGMGSFTLGPSGKMALERRLPELTRSERPILIVGAADPSGNEQVNETLSDARAQAVAEWLLVHGVDAQRMQTRAVGHEGAVGSTLDRRVDIWLGGSR